MERTFLKKLFTTALAIAFVAFYIPRSSVAQDIPAAEDTQDVIDMVVGDVQTVPVNNLSRVSVTNPDVADISDAQSDKVSLLAKKAGKTILFLWDAGGKRTVNVRVVNEDLSAVKGRIQKVLDEAGITGLSLEENSDIGKVVISGALPKDDKTRLGDILDPYSDAILNLVKEEKNEELIQVDMQVVEISTTLEKQLGILWGTASTTNTTDTSGDITGTTQNVNSGQLALNYNENPPTGDKFKDLFKIGNFMRTSSLEATVNALLQEGKARLISKPRLVVVSGKQASFLVGGEIPIENTTTSAAGLQQTSSTTYAQYGVNMTVTPTIREGKIDVVLNVDIRDVDNSPPTGSQGVAFITRTASTDLLMDNKQTIALAGLIKYSDSKQITEVPYLSKIPILGALFRNTNVPGDTNTEMVIILTPTVLTDKKFAETQLVMPTPEERGAYKEIDSRYEHEALPSWPAPKVIPVVASMSPGAFGELTAYARMVQVKISKAISYPQAAMGNDVEGTVKLKLHILKDGSLDSEEVMESSGNDVLDQDAMQAAKSAAPYDAFTGGMDQQDMVFTIPIVYNKLITQAQAPAEKVIASY